MAIQAAVRPEISWEGGTSPFQVSWQKLMMWFFLVSDALLFAGFLVAYGYVRLSSDSWPDQGEVFTMALIGVMTFVLITSSATMASAVGGARDGDLIRARKFVIMTAVGGVLFLGMQAFEWTTLISEGATLTQNPWGVKGFSAFFFVITGFHGIHVLIGIVILVITAVRLGRGQTTAAGVELTGLYWHFVDLIWVFIFTCFYLI